MSDWRPTVNSSNLLKRAQLLNQARKFFNERDVLEVETPLACSYTVTEPNIESFGFWANGSMRYLQTSPEYAMKRLLASGAPDIFQICKSFHNGEQGSLHNPEFTIIEWYRHAYDLAQIMRETVDLITCLLNKNDAALDVNFVSYRELTERVLGAPLDALTEDEIKNLAAENGLVIPDDFSYMQGVDFLFSHRVEPSMDSKSVTVVFHYPSAQAALARLNDHDKTLADRFEVFYQGVELANGYVELTDADQLQMRFQNDQVTRNNRGQVPVDIDKHFMQSLHRGLPECAGVAVGFDRLMMLAVGAESLSEVLSFGWSNS